MINTPECRENDNIFDTDTEMEHDTSHSTEELENITLKKYY